MPFYLTGNPVPSESVLDIRDNSKNLDLALNDITSTIWTDRLGRSRMSWLGLESAFSVKLSDFESRFTSQIVEQEATFDASQADKENRFQHFLVSSGYVFLGDYENGPFQFSARNQYIRYNNQYYRLNAATDVGFTTTGTDATSFANDVIHFVLMDGDTLRQNLGSGEPGMGADMLAFRGILGTNFNLGSYIREGYIRVWSRDELVAAVNHVNTVVKKPTEIRLSRVFEPWTAAQTDIDLTWVSLVGEGGFCYIDATGIPNVEGNYWLRLFNSGASNINNLGNIYAAKLSGIFAIGPGAASLVDAVLYHAPSGSASSFTTRNLGTMHFRTGDSYRNNAYIIKHWGRSISRCANHVWMPAGYSNYGEAIEYYASTISTSNGVGVRNDNPNGDIRIHGGSCDYMGRIAVANAGRIEFYGTHIEFNNASNKLTGIPFETAAAETSEIVITGGRILGYVTPLPEAVTTLFQCGANTNGITLDKVMLMNVSLNDSTMPINNGTGPFTTKDIRVIDGSGNPKVPMLKADAQNLLFDPNFTQAGIVDWYIASDTGALTSRTDGVNIKLAKDTVTFRPGGDASMKVTKTYGIGSSAEIHVRVPIKAGKLAMYQLYVKGAALTGSIFVSAHYSAAQYHNQIGVPVSARSVQFGPARTLNATNITDWVRVNQQQARYYTPEWATHMVLRINLIGMSAGDLYIDDVKVTEL
ncbi:phage tail fiber protein [Klebsiella pneumoniae]|uniref:hypothetical protein n=1 Tax=Klebsiella pneumoniae TaxID=573 RepID=UPI003B27B01C